VDQLRQVDLITTGHIKGLYHRKNYHEKWKLIHDEQFMKDEYLEKTESTCSVWKCFILHTATLHTTRFCGTKSWVLSSIAKLKLKTSEVKE